MSRSTVVKITTTIAAVAAGLIILGPLMAQTDRPATPSTSVVATSTTETDDPAPTPTPTSSPDPNNPWD